MTAVSSPSDNIFPKNFEATSHVNKITTAATAGLWPDHDTENAPDTLQVVALDKTGRVKHQLTSTVSVSLDSPIS